MSALHDLRQYTVAAVFALVASLPIAGGALAATKCSPGFADCDGKASNGCEINISTDANNCGACGKVCSTANGTPSCTAGQCTIASCNAGFANCNNNAADGCEINTNTDPNNCGACGKQCSAANGTPACTAGQCTISSCNAGFANCNNNAADGCEINTNTDPNNCGACGHVCGAGTTCTNGACVAAAPTCTDGIKNGTETDVDCGGGTCPACGMNLRCQLDGDCASNACDAVNLTCVSNQCIDHRKDGQETDVDCGGGACPACGMGLHCQLDSDCASNACDGVTLTCVSNQCIDHRKDGQETDVDCGGGTCAACAVGKTCVTNFDCQSGHICNANHVCQ